MRLGSLSPIIQVNDGNTYYFNHGSFYLIFRYEDSILNNYDAEIEICRQIICYIKSDSIDTDPDWIFSFNESIVSDEDYQGLICRKINGKILFGLSGNLPGNYSYLEIPINDIETRNKIASFYTKLMDMLLYKKDNSLGNTLKRIFF